MKRFGFSTLELAFAIAFAAVIVAALVLVADPLERARQERDLRVSNDSTTFLSAINQYFLARGQFPWAPEVGIRWTQIDQSTVSLEKLIESGSLPQDFISRRTIVDPKDRFYVAKGTKVSDPVFACFVPESEKQRMRTGELYKIDTKSNFPQTGILPSCPSNVTWQEEDVCYICFSR